MENILEDRKVTQAVTDLLVSRLYQQTPFKDKIWVTGLVMLGISLLLFSLAAFTLTDEGNAFGVFMLIYLLPVIYYILQTRNRNYLKQSGFYHPTFGHTTLLLILFLVSAYALNRSLFVFQDSTTWLSVYLVIAAVPYVFYHCYGYLPPVLRLIFQVATGASLLLWLYLSLYLAPIYYFGLIAAPALGISLHTFVPFLLLWFGIRMARKSCRTFGEITAFGAGLLLPLLITGLFLWQWHQTNAQIARVGHTLETEDQNHLPGWVRVSQLLEKNWVNQKFISSNLVYVTEPSGGWGMGRRGFDEVKKHDPLVAVASYFFGQTNLSDAEKIKVLETSYDARHQAQEKLWSGENLQTSGVVSRARLYPNFRLAYTEKTLRIRNTAKTTWQNQQEALYTFHLPAGGVVTSLSLWIEGREEKGYLTTKSKADSAYTTIVGKESRDPSVVHWQEGNTVLVRVFPCTPTEERQFKIGVTTPLQKIGKNLVYENFYFEGPSPQQATETVYLQFNQEPQGLEADYALSKNPNHSYGYEGPYQPNRRLSFKAPALSGAAFTFASQKYALSEVVPQYGHFTPAAVYLDVNRSWTVAEWQAVRRATQQAATYVYADGFIQVTAQNQETLFKKLQTLQFSLFPVYLLPNPASVLLVSKSHLPGPNLQDLKETHFTHHLQSYLQNSATLRVFNLGSEKSAYIKILKEMRLLVYDEGTPEKLAALLQKRQFLTDPEDAATVVLEEAQVKITAAPSLLPTTGPAPDHLLRLFAYNDIMKKINRHYFKPDAAPAELITAAATANVVSPVSSLIVLETQRDYDRFDITKSKNSLGNATAKAAGSVPEPHEWLLIILAAFTIGYLLLKPYLKARFA